MRRVTLAPIVLGGLLLGLAATALAQPRETRLTGTVRDESGAVLVGAIVTARHVASGAVARAVSDDRGAYALTGLAAGVHAVDAVAPGFRSQRLPVTIVSGERVTLDLTLVIAPLTETVTVTRAAQDLSAVPMAIGLVSETAVQDGQRRVSMAESLAGIPGLFVQDRGNYSESYGVRLSLRAPLRGVGIGIRGVHLVQDGVPLTVADGTSQPTNIDIGSLGTVEVIRGPSSVLYGNAAGGVVTLTSEIPSSRRLVVEPDVQFGSHGYERQQVKTTGTLGKVGYLVNVARMQTDGFRDHSRAEARQANVVIRASVSPATDVRGAFNVFHMPFGESPSTLSLEDARLRPTSVRALAVDHGLGEASTQGQGGLTVEHRFDGGQVFRTTGWAMWRDVWNPIPNRIIDLSRTGGGIRSEYSGSATRGSLPIVWTTGLDTSYQRDDSVEYVNEGVAGGPRTREGARLVDQLETVRSLAPFAQVSVAPRPRWMLTAGIRFDHYRFAAADRLFTNGDQSGDRTLSAFSPAAGVTYLASQGINIYGNVATAYETPTTQELSNRPSGEGGFNPDLEPERLLSVEGGVRGLVSAWRLRYDVAVYRSRLTNALVQYQRADEQEFFRNAGESSRTGVEALVEWTPVTRVNARLAYTYQRFTFVRFVTDTDDFSGKREPGAPPHQLFLGLTADTRFGLRSVAEVRWMDGYPVNNANTFTNWSSTVVNLRFHLKSAWRALGVRPFLGIANVFDERYNGSTIPNAFGNRYYEPSAGRTFYAGLGVEVGRP
jgi:iron complex outermembrane recepter protein